MADLAPQNSIHCSIWITKTLWNTHNLTHEPCHFYNPWDLARISELVHRLILCTDWKLRGNITSASQAARS